MSEMPKAYEPQQYEDEIYRRWEASGLFNPDVCVAKGHTAPDAAPFSVVLPPPNVTGTLHMGHAAMLAIEDMMVRYHRMKGDRTLWLPGTDHAAIATESKVEGILIKNGEYKKPKEELGRDTFLERVKQFAQDSHDTIVNQSKKMGSSLDWSREAYTLDEARSHAVRTVFKQMYEDGLIYRGDRIVNWDPVMQSNVSDEEMEWKEEKTPFYYFQYGPFEIGTVRPETKFGDKYIVMHPNDERYQEYEHGQKITVEWINGPIVATIIKDEAADPEFGSGVMTITPWHSTIDFEIAKRHKLDIEQVIGYDEKLLPVAAEFAGLDAVEARPAIIKKLKEKGLLNRVDENYIHNVAVNYRGGKMIEPQVRKQWFVDVNKKVAGRGRFAGRQVSLKEMMQEVVRDGAVEIVPDRFNKTYFHWIDNLRDWCISRQIWFGHQIPVWYKKPNKPIELTFVTHGSTEDNINDTYSGDFDIELSEQGRLESIKQGELLAHQDFDLIITSDLKRAVETASLTFGDRSIPVIHDPRLREIDLGTSRIADIERHITIPFAGGESCVQVGVRMRSFLAEIVEKYPGKKIAIIAHRVPQLALEVILNNKSWYDSIQEDWRLKKPKAWQAGWKYQLSELQVVDVVTPEGTDWKQDPDTLDTWFSSGLWTFSTLGWPTTTIDFIRHGEAENNVAEKVSDDMDRYHLTERGRGQVVELADQLKNKGITAIIASPVLRTRETAEILSDKLGVPITWDERLREVGVGDLQDHSEADLQEARERADWTVQTPYGIEPYVSLRSRTHRAIKDIVHQYRGQRVAIVSHGDTLSVIKQFGTDIYSNEIGRPQGRATVDTRHFDSDGRQNTDLSVYHPTSVLETGYDILFFWVARMILMTTYTLGDVPFKTVYLHGLVRDEQGRKMSKSLGNIIDPLDMIAKYGTDATRLSLLLGNTPGNDMKLSEEKIAGFRNFTNKLWNISRFVISNLPTELQASGEVPIAKTLADRWILARLNETVTVVSENIEKYNFSYAGEVLRDFTWTDFADWYLEIAKIEGNKAEILHYVLTTILKLWHPYTPYVTEAIWAQLHSAEDLIMVAKWPTKYEVNTVPDFALMQNIIVGIRAVRSTNKIEPAKLVTVAISAGDKKDVLTENETVIKGLARCESIEVASAIGKPETAVGFVEGNVEVFVDLAGLVDKDKERARLEKEIASVAPYVESMKKKLSNEQFVNNAPPAVIDIERKKLADAEAKLAALTTQLTNL